MKIDEAVFLVQSDTTVGLLSKNAKKLAFIKQRDPKKPFLKSVATFRELKGFSRVPKRFKRFVRRKKRATFVYPNKNAIRVVQDHRHKNFLKRFGWMYSTSANKAAEEFDFSYVKDKVDIIVYDTLRFTQSNSSSLYRLNRKKMRRLR